MGIFHCCSSSTMSGKTTKFGNAPRPEFGGRPVASTSTTSTSTQTRPQPKITKVPVVQSEEKVAFKKAREVYNEAWKSYYDACKESVRKEIIESEAETKLVGAK